MNTNVKEHFGWLTCQRGSFSEDHFVSSNHSPVLYLQDFRNYQYTLPVVKGLVVDMEVRKTCIRIPSNRYNEVRVSTSLLHHTQDDQ